MTVISTDRSSVFLNREFRCLWAAAVQSLAGDQLARVALTVLVFEATHSALATAAAYSVTFLPGLAGATLGHLADRIPRRQLMIGCDLLRAALLALMALPAAPTWLVCVLLGAAVAIGGPFNAASTAVLADMFDGDRYRSAVALRQAGGQAAQLIGFGVGGVAVAAAGPRVALLIDAGTYLVSAGLLKYGLQHRAVNAAGVAPVDRSVRRGLSLVLTDRGQRGRLVIVGLVGFWIVPEGLAGPYADARGSGSVGVGVLLAALPAGYVLGSLLARRLSAAAAHRLIGPLTVAAGLPLLACIATPPLPVAAALWAICGAATGYMPVVIADYISAAPAARRGQAAGLSAATALLTQGVGVVAGGAIAQAWTPGGAIAAAGGAGSVCALMLIDGQRRRAKSTPIESGCSNSDV